MSVAPPTAPRLSPEPAAGPSRKGVKDMIIERFEQKYIIHPELVPQIREFIKPFCIPDPNGKGEVPEYTVTTLQIDTPLYDLALMKERKYHSRFKLRIRTYGSKPEHPVFFEIKRKINNVIVKSRAKMSLGEYNTPEPGYIVMHPEKAPLLKTPKDNNYFIEFCRIANKIYARPKMLIRYVRESYFGANDDYARVTFDRRLCYRPTRSWHIPPPDDGGIWRPLDTQTGLNRPFAGYIFELKAMADSPKWMLELVERFNLQTTGFCKYATAFRLESIYRGFSYTDQSENTTY